VRRLLIITAVLVLGAAQPAGAATIDNTIGRMLARSSFAGKHTSLIVWDRTTRRMLSVHQRDRELRPASNMKLLTSSAVFEREGASARLFTRVYATGSLSGGTLHGSLWLVGGGDPSLSTDVFATKAFGGYSGHLANLAAAVRGAGIVRVTGRLYGDESRFDSRRTAPFWKPSYWMDCPPISALLVNEDLYRFGNPHASANPPLYAAQVFHKSLRGHGVTFAHGTRAGVRPAGARVVAVERSPTFARMLRHMDHVSDNLFAEVFSKDLAVHGGLRGTTKNGVRATRNALGDIGVSLAGARIYDGSGLSRGDRLSARQVLSVLTHAAKQPWGATLRADLPLAGVSGTLDDRMRSGPAHANVQAKTGTLNDASALSGYVTAANGHHLVFAMLMNREGMNIAAAQALQDRICQLLAASSPS
jgi:D-alanyl-D-alanine carboxypeptidase/D-alanyl-D-alanine-endopeptidase (penicillin-binding protein 4)